MNVHDSSRYINNKNLYEAEWEKTNTYCYSLTIPISIREKETNEIVKTDLVRWLNVLGISVAKEKRTVECLKLIITDSSLLKLNKSGEEYTLLNLQDLAQHINLTIPNIPWISDEAIKKDKYSFNLDELNKDTITNVALLQKVLKKYGIGLAETKKELDMIVVTDKARNN